MVVLVVRTKLVGLVDVAKMVVDVVVDIVVDVILVVVTVLLVTKAF